MAPSDCFPEPADCASLAFLTMTDLCSDFLNVEAPRAADSQQAKTGRERWLDALGGDDGETASRAAASALASTPAGGRLLDAIFGNSGYLTFIAEQEPKFFLDLLRAGVDPAWRAVMADLGAACGDAVRDNDPSIPLRLAKRRAALVTAVADICGLWDLDDVTTALTRFADAALRCAVSYLLANAARRRLLTLADPADPEKGSGYIVLALGKHGAGELNYSSDIDLVVLYDPDRIDAPDPDSLQQTFVRLTRQLVQIIGQRTEAGYVFRCDLRLRPDPNSTPLAISVHAAETYYESTGQNWERAAFIKARPVAGDLDAGRQFLHRLQPFIWRRYLDFAAIQDIHSIKRQIDSHRGNKAIKVEGQNVKLGHGGIREIEFFAQTQQLVWGGRLPELRNRRTLCALASLCDAGNISEQVRDELSESYKYLRRLEHRLQMIADEQTHALPTDADRFAALAVFLGHDDPETFRDELLFHFRRVAGHYGELFSGAPTLAVADAIGGNLVFTGSDPDPETLETLARLGFDDSARVDETVRGWHRGHVRVMQSARARGLLTELTPLLLKQLARAPDADAAFRAFDAFLAGLPAGVQLFSMLAAHPELLELLADVLGTAPRIADHLTKNPALLEGVLTGDFFSPLPEPELLAEELSRLLDRARGLEDVLDLTRRWANERRFQIGVRCLQQSVPAAEEGRSWSNLAESCIRVLLPRIEQEFRTRHGAVAGCEMAVVAMGKLGSREMTATSDLDLIFVYSTPTEGATSDGERPLAASQYFARLSQKFINALTAPTAAGRLFEVDMRLRPSGRAGPIATSAEAFARYQREQAWTWEHMALTRARVIAGPRPLRQEIEAAMRGVLTRPRDEKALLRDVADMRARIEREKPAESLWATKRIRGGLIDIEFIAQYLQLRHAHERPEILSQSTRTVLQRAVEAEVLAPAPAATLLEALSLLQSVQARLRLTIEGAIEASGGDDAAPSLIRAVDGTCGLEFPALVDKMDSMAGDSYRIFKDLIENPATAVASE